MMFDDLLKPDVGQPAAHLHLVSKGNFDSWRSTQTPAVKAALAATCFSGGPGETTIIPGPNRELFDTVAGVADCNDLGPWDLATATAQLPAGTYRLVGRKAGAAQFGWLLSHYHFDGYSGANIEIPRRCLLVDNPDQITLFVRLAEAVALLRDLINRPANDLGPSALAEAVAMQGEMFGAVTRVVEGEALLDNGYPAVHAVGRAAAEVPRMIELSWGEPNGFKLTLIGKGVCFDTGGLYIKTGPAMRHMKKDMGGAAHALALARLVMGANLPVRLRLLIPAVENAISGSAFRPSDVIRTRKGLSVEVGDTDAEGRLILCDALAAAAEDGPDLIIDFATLTGAARAALGPEIAALFTNDDDLAHRFICAGIETGDPVWRLPLWAPYLDMMKSSIADINNIGDRTVAGAITAALFLERFVERGMRWAHLDIHAWNAIDRPGRPVGGDATGLLAAWAVVGELVAGRDRRHGASRGSGEASLRERPATMAGQPSGSDGSSIRPQS